MAWIESHQELWRHPKTKKLARLLAVSVPTAIGHLHGIWYWALDFAQDGDLRRYDPEEIADAALWEGEPVRFIEALVAAGYLDQTDNGLTIHDWYSRLSEYKKSEKRSAFTSVRWAQQTEASKDWGNLAVNKNPIFVTNARVAGHSYPAHELLESYAVTLYDLDVSRERQLRAATSSTEQANRARNAGRLRILEEKERELREKAEALISKCQTPDEREMLRMRYLMLMDWATIARVLYGDKPGFYDGKMYRQRALMLHKDTMAWLEKGLLTEEKHEDENT